MCKVFCTVSNAEKLTFQKSLRVVSMLTSCSFSLTSRMFLRLMLAL